MIRSSRIPPLLDKICTDGIKLSLLISKDGELLGSSTSQKQQPQTPPTSKNKTTSESGDENIASISSPSWGSMNPSDIGALIAEVVEDYKRLGCELTLLDPSFAQSSSVGSRTDNLGGNSKHLRQQQQQQSSSNHEMQRQSQLMDDGSGKNASSTVTAGGGNDLSKMKERNGSHKDRGRFNCLLMELEMVSALFVLFYININKSFPNYLLNNKSISNVLINF